MPKFVKIKSGVVVQKQPYPASGFIEAPAHVVCGMLFDGQDYSNPPPSPDETNEDQMIAFLDSPLMADFVQALEDESPKPRNTFRAAAIAKAAARDA